MSKIQSSKKYKRPECVGKIVQCNFCGGESKVANSTTLFVEGEQIFVSCPYCKMLTLVDNDIFKNNKEKMLRFLKSQVEPIKNIEDENIRLPLQRLLDAMYSLLNE